MVATAARAPGPRALPLVGGMLQLRGDPLARIRALRARYGGFVRLGPLGQGDVFLVTDPIAIRHVLLDNYKNYKKGRAAQRLRPVLGQGSLLLDGDPWRKRRRLVQPAFHRDKMAALTHTFVEHTDQMLARWAPAMHARRPLDARAEMLELTMGLTLRNMFCADAVTLQPLVVAWQHLYDELSRRRLRIARLPAWVPGQRRPAHVVALATVHRILDDLIRRGHEVDDGSVLAMLLRARDEDDGRLSDAELRDEVMTLFVGGYETSSNALAFTLAMLAAAPAEAARQRAEVDAVLGDRLPTAADLARLPYTRAILDESMRLFPPSWMITREALSDDRVAGHPVARGSQLLVSAYGVHHAPEIWPEPDAFRPARFLPDAPAVPRFAHLPFGGGPRICVGEQYALVEMQLILARLAQRVTLTLAPGTRIVPQAHVGLRPRFPLTLLATAR